MENPKIGRLGNVRDIMKIKEIEWKGVQDSLKIMGWTDCEHIVNINSFQDPWFVHEVLKGVFKPLKKSRDHDLVVEIGEVTVILGIYRTVKTILLQEKDWDKFLANMLSINLPSPDKELDDKTCVVCNGPSEGGYAYLEEEVCMRCYNSGDYKRYLDKKEE